MLGSSISREDSLAYSIPATLTRFCSNKLPLINHHVQGQRIIEDIDTILNTDRFNSFDKFHETTKKLIQRYRKSNVITESFKVPTGGANGRGRWVIHKAADVLRVTADVTSPVNYRLIDYHQNPWHIAQWSAATPPGGMDLDLVIIDLPEQIDRLRPGELSGKIILSRQPLRDLWARIAKNGAVGIISDQPVPEQPDTIMWQKLGWGGIPLGTALDPIVGLVISERQGQRLRELQLQGSTVTLNVEVDIRHYAGQHDMVSGTILGQEDSQDEVWCLAHSAEPGAADNASGVAVCLETARLLSALITSGKLPQPRRSIRFLNGYECYSYFYYLEHGERLQPPLAGLNLDMVGLKPHLCNNQLYWHETIPMSAQFVNDVGQVIYSSVLREKYPAYQLKRGSFRSTDDTLIGDPKYGFPCPWLTNCWRKEDEMYNDYHTSNDTLQTLSVEGLAMCAAGTAGYLYFLANAGNEELIELAIAETKLIIDAIHKSNIDSSTSQVQYLHEQHSLSMKQLQRWMWGSSRREMLNHLVTCKREVDKAVEITNAKQNSSHSSTLLTVFNRKVNKAKCIPRRTAPLIPDLHNVVPDVRKRLTTMKNQVRPWTLYWANGNRSIAEIAEILECEYRESVDLDKVIAFFDIHAELGYVQLIKPGQLVTMTQLVHDLMALSLRPGMDVMVHSSLSKIGHVQGGACTVVDALLVAIGKEGTLVMPSFNHRKARVFNPATTPTTNGAIADAMWRRPDAVRSINGTHSVTAIGPKAEEWCKDHYRVGVWAQESPIGKIIHEEGYILCLGLTHNRITANHVAEMSIPCSCVDPFGNKDLVLMEDGCVHTMKGLAYRSSECPVPRVKINAKLGHGIFQRCGKVGKADATLYKAIDLWNIRRSQISTICPSCQIKPKYLS